MVPAGVVIASITASTMLWVTWMNSTRKSTNLFYLPRFDRDELGLVKQAVFLQLAFHQPKRVSGSVNGDMHQCR